MWRVQGFVGRVFSRCHGNTPLRLSQNHHVEDEVINTSTFLSTGRQSPDTLRKRRMETRDGRRGPLNSATLGSRATLLWMLWAGEQLWFC